MKKTYIAIDLKSFYASVECQERGIDPLTTNLVVADASRTDKTICLAVTPSLKQYGLSGRSRLFEVVSKVKEVNEQRRRKAPHFQLVKSSTNDIELKEHPEYALDYIIATPRMAYYMEYSTKIFKIYQKYISSDDIHVYSVDEVFMDVTSYLNSYQMSAHDLAMTMIKDVLANTGITATAGIGTNLYLCKVAMDIVAKHIPADADGVRIAELDEMSYRHMLWEHRPLTDFWRVGKGYSKKLEENGMYTMGDVARCSLENEKLLYDLFGVNAQLLIDHAWGWEPCEIRHIKQYRPQSNSTSMGQVLSKPYTFEKGRLIVKEMVELLTLDLVSKHVVTDQIVLNIAYDVENLKDSYRIDHIESITTDMYGRKIPKPAHGSTNLEFPTSSTDLIRQATVSLYDRVVNHHLLVRKINIAAMHLQDEKTVTFVTNNEQLDLFTDYEQKELKEKQKKEALRKERALQETLLKIKSKYGKNAALKGMNLEEGATTIERNAEIGGHKA